MHFGVENREKDIRFCFQNRNKCLLCCWHLCDSHYCTVLCNEDFHYCCRIMQRVAYVSQQLTGYIYELFICQSLSYRFCQLMCCIAMHLRQHQITYKHNECGWIRAELIRFGIARHFRHHGKRRVKNGGKHSINLLLHSNYGFQYSKNTIKHFHCYNLAFYNIFKIV